jgi:hypothetical protein
LPFRADPFEKCDQLELEENYWVNRWPSRAGIELGSQLTDNTQINASFYLAIEIIRRHQMFEADSSEGLEIPDFVTEHAAPRCPLLLKKLLKLNIIRKSYIVRRLLSSYRLSPYLISFFA